MHKCKRIATFSSPLRIQPASRHSQTYQTTLCFGPKNSLLVMPIGSEPCQRFWFDVIERTQQSLKTLDSQNNYKLGAQKCKHLRNLKGNIFVSSEIRQIKGNLHVGVKLKWNEIDKQTFPQSFFWKHKLIWKNSAFINIKWYEANWKVVKKASIFQFDRK